MSIIMVVDPDYKGKDPESPSAPRIPRAWAMRKLRTQGMSIGDIARKYEVPYAMAYKMINPPRQRASSSKSTTAKALTTERLSTMKRSQLEKIVYNRRAKTPSELKRVAAASDELDRRFPGWND